MDVRITKTVIVKEYNQYYQTHINPNAVMKCLCSFTSNEMLI